MLDTIVITKEKRVTAPRAPQPCDDKMVSEPRRREASVNNKAYKASHLHSPNTKIQSLSTCILTSAFMQQLIQADMPPQRSFQLNN